MTTTPLQRILAWLALTCAVPVPRTVVAADVSPFFTRNQSPMVQIFGLPPAEPASLVPHGALDVRLTGDIANSCVLDFSTDELVLLDGETYRATLGLRYRLFKELQVGLDIPYVWHEPGTLDGFIDSWHDLLATPEGWRIERKNDRLAYLYTDDGPPEFFISRSTSGVGDLVLCGATPLYADPRAARRASLHAGLKLPTGNSRDLLGSGSTDLSVRLIGCDAASLSSLGLACTGSLGLLLMTEGNILEDKQQPCVAFGFLSLDWELAGWLHPKLQVEGHSPFYDDTQMDHLGPWAAQIVVGTSVLPTPDLTVDLALAEDIASGTTPDIAFHIAVRMRL
jgi:hypothetical protein